MSVSSAQTSLALASALIARAEAACERWRESKDDSELKPVLAFWEAAELLMRDAQARSRGARLMPPGGPLHPYSTDLSQYEPRCAACHTKHDLAAAAA